MSVAARYQKFNTFPFCKGEEFVGGFPFQNMEMGTARFRTVETAQKAAEDVLQKEEVQSWLRVTACEVTVNEYKQEKPGRPGKDTKYRKVEIPVMLFEIEETKNDCLFKLTDKMAPALDALTYFPADTPKYEIYQPGGIGTHWTGIVSGYHRFVDALESYITGVEIPLPSRFFQLDDEANRLYRDMLDEWHSVEK